MPGSEFWWDLGSSAGILCITTKLENDHFLYMPLTGLAVYVGQYTNPNFKAVPKGRSDEFWGRISENRASAIREALLKHGVTTDRLPETEAA